MKLYTVLLGFAFALTASLASPASENQKEKNKAAPLLQSASVSGSGSASGSSLLGAISAVAAAAAASSKTNSKKGKSGYAHGNNGGGYASVNIGYSGVNPGYSGVNPGYSGVNLGYSGVNPGYSGVNTGYNGVNNGHGVAGSGYGSAGAVQTVLNFHSQNNAYASDVTTDPTTGTHDPTAATTHAPSTDTHAQKPVNYVIYIQPQAVNGQYQKPNYGLGQYGGSNLNTGNTYGAGQSLYSLGAQNQVYAAPGGQYFHSGSLGGYGVQANYAAPGSTGYHTGLSAGGYNSVQRPYNLAVGNYGVHSAGLSNVGMYQSGSQAAYVQAPPQPVYSSVAGYPTVQVAPPAVSSYHGSASSAYHHRPQVAAYSSAQHSKPQSIYVSTYTQPQIYLKPSYVKPAYGKPVLSSASYGNGRPLSYMSGSSAGSGYDKTSAALALQAAIGAYGKPAGSSIGKLQAAYQSPELYVALDEEGKRKKSQQQL